MTEFSGDVSLPPVHGEFNEADIVELQGAGLVRDPADCADVVRGLGEPIDPAGVRAVLRGAFGGLIETDSDQAETGAADESAALE